MRPRVLAATVATLATQAWGAGQERIGLSLDAPQPGEQVHLSVPFVEVSGSTGSAELFSADVVIALDLSGGALRASGVDVDRDGVVGETRKFAEHEQKRAASAPAQSFTSDPDDTIAQAELAATRPVITALALRQNRVGLLTFAQTTRARAPVGSPAHALAAAERITLRENREGADLHRALRIAARMLDLAPRALGPDRTRAILLFSDGRAGHPSEGRARRKAPQTARELRERGIELYAFQLGDDGEPEFLAELAAAAGGRVIEVANPGALLSDLPLPQLAPRKLSIRNRTTGESARAIRTAADGRFDAFAPLRPGANDIEIRAELADGSDAVVERRVFYSVPENESEEDRRRAARLLVELRWRSRDLQREQLLLPQ